MRIVRGNRSTRTKPAPVPLCPPQIPHDISLYLAVLLTRDSMCSEIRTRLALKRYGAYVKFNFETKSEIWIRVQVAYRLIGVQESYYRELWGCQLDLTGTGLFYFLIYVVYTRKYGEGKKIHLKILILFKPLWIRRKKWFWHAFCLSLCLYVSMTGWMCASLPPKRWRVLVIFGIQEFICQRPVSGRSQWPRGIRHALSSLARKLGSWVRNPLKTWMSVCVYSVFVLFCV
jgi:hypothetical protein